MCQLLLKFVSQSFCSFKISGPFQNPYLGLKIKITNGKFFVVRFLVILYPPQCFLKTHKESISFETIKGAFQTLFIYDNPKLSKENMNIFVKHEHFDQFSQF